MAPPALLVEGATRAPVTERYPTLYLIADGRIVDRKPSEGSAAEQIKDLQAIIDGK